MKRLMLCLAVFSSSASAASFDCRKAGTKVEQMICANADLSAKDEEIAKWFKDAKKLLAQDSGDEAKELAEAQKHWLSTVRNECGSTECLDAVMTKHVADLEAMYKSLPKTPEERALARAAVAIVRARGEANEIGKALARLRTDTGVSGSAAAFKSCLTLAALIHSPASNACPPSSGSSPLPTCVSVSAGTPCWGGPYLASVPGNDPWGSPYRFSADTSGAITVRSDGPDKRPGTGDDVSRIY